MTAIVHCERHFARIKQHSSLVSSDLHRRGYEGTSCLTRFWAAPGEQIVASRITNRFQHQKIRYPNKARVLPVTNPPLPPMSCHRPRRPLPEGQNRWNTFPGCEVRLVNHLARSNWDIGCTFLNRVNGE